MSHHTYQPTAQDEQDEEQVAADLELDWYPPPASTFWDSAAAGETARYTQPLSGRDTRDRASYHSSESAATAVNGELDQYYHGEDAKLKDGCVLLDAMSRAGLNGRLCQGGLVSNIPKGPLQ
jgi:hypothetical protein